MGAGTLGADEFQALGASLGFDLTRKQAQVTAVEAHRGSRVPRPTIPFFEPDRHDAHLLPPLVVYEFRYMVSCTRHPIAELSNARLYGAAH